MKKLSAFLLSVFTVLVGVFAVACDKEIKIDFTTEGHYLEMYIGEEIDISKEVKVEGGLIDDVVIKSLDPSIAGITNNKTLTAQNAGTTLVTATIKDKVANLEVKVIGNPLVAGIPQGLRYDEIVDAVVWEPVFLNIDGNIETVNSYIVEVINAGQTTTHTVSGDNRFFIETPGESVIKVKSAQRKDANKLIYKESSFSTAITLSKLPKPYNLKYNDELNLLSWQADDVCKKFKVKVNGVISEEVTDKQMPIILSNLNEHKQEKFDISVIAVAEDDTKVYVKNESEKISLTRLYAPSLNIQNGVITWDSTQTGDFKYTINIKSNTGVNISKVVEKNEYSLPELEAGEYTVSIKAISSSDSYLSSENESKLERVVKIAPVSLAFDTVEKQIRVIGYEDKKIVLNIIKNNENLERIEVYGGVYNWTKTEPGDYKITAMATAQQSNDINSDISNQLEIKQLEKLDPQTLSQIVDENNNYVVSFSEVSGANTYDFSVSYNSSSPVNFVHDDNYNFGNVDEIFANEGKYTIYITALNSSSLGENKFVLPSTTLLEVNRLGDLHLMQQKEQEDVKFINWDSLANCVGYKYIMEKDSKLFKEDINLTNSFNVSTLPFGHYVFKAKALGVEQSTRMYLDSLNYASTSFDKIHTLKTPEISFDRNTGIISVTKVEFASGYDILMGGVQLLYEDTKDVIEIDIKDKIANKGKYIITAQAKNENNILIKKSNINTINIIRHDAPNNFTLSSEGGIKINNVPELGLSDLKNYELKINDIEASKLDKANTFVVKAKFIAKDTYQLVNDVKTYYLDSQVNSFNIERLQKPSKPVFLNGVISWAVCEESNFVYALHIVQGDRKTEEILTTNSINLNQIGWLNKNEPFTVAVEYKLGTSGATIVLPIAKSQKFSSSISDETTIQKIIYKMGLKAKEENGETTIDWQPFNQEGVSYKLNIDSQKIQEGELYTYKSSTAFNEAKRYIVSVVAKKDGWIESDPQTIFVERLKVVDALNISDKEEISAVTGYKIYNDQTNTSKEYQLERISIKNNGDEITSLTKFDGVEINVDVQLIAKEYLEGEYYYLTSNVSTFKFSRIQQPNAPRVNNYVVSWDTIDHIGGYTLKFSTLEDMYEINLQDVNEISLNDPKIVKILEKINKNNINVSMKVVVTSFRATTGATYLLSSIYSQEKQITKLLAVKDIKVVSADTDYKQETLKISWVYDGDASITQGFVIDIYNGNKKIETREVEGGVRDISSKNIFTTEGKWSVKIFAKGQKNALNSSTASSQEYTRFKAPTKLAIKENALLSWQGVANATSYVVSYFHNDIIKGEIQNITTTSCSLNKELLQQVFDGDIVIKVLAVGGKGQDPARTFSSAYSAELTAVKLAKASFELTPSSIKVVGSYTQQNNMTFDLVIKQDNRDVKKITLKLNEIYTFEDWRYLDTDEFVPTNVEKEYTFIVTAHNKTENVLYSDEYTITANKLQSVQNLGFKRDLETDSLVHFNADSVLNASHYHISVGQYQTTNVSISVDKLDLPVKDEFEKALDSNFKISVYAQGEIGKNGVNYINSSVATIEGQKLKPVSNFRVYKGLICWNKTDMATDYNLRLDSMNILSGYVQGGVHKTVEDLKGKTGEHNVNIRAIGNVTTTLKTKDIILDSSYLRNQETYELINLSVVKLNVPQNYQVTNGYISFNFVEFADSYVAEIETEKGKTQFTLKQIVDESAEIKKMYSTEMYSKLTPNKYYNVKIVAKTSIKNYLYSDATSAIQIRILSNSTQDSLKIIQSIKEEGTSSTDNTISKLVWYNNDSAVNGYNIFLNGKMTTVGTEISEFVLDKNDELKSGSYNSIYVVVAGSSGKEKADLNSVDSEIIRFTKLATPKPMVKNGQLAWNKVAGANGYLVYLNGKQYGNRILGTNTLNVDNISQKNPGIYERFEVRALSTDSNNIASSLGLYEGPNEKEEIVPITVVKPMQPEMFSLNSGELRWKLSLAKLLEFVKSGVYQPITATTSSVAKSTIRLNFNNNNVNYPFDFSAYDFFYTDASTIDGIASFVPADYQQYLEILKKELTSPTWPTLDYSFRDKAKSLPAGEYNLSLTQIGNNYNLLNSNASMTKNIYVPFAPEIFIEYSKENGYTLRWDSITIPGKYNIKNVEYVVVGECKNLEDKADTKLSRKVIASTTGTSLNLTELVNAGKIDTSYVNLYVYVKGDNKAVLNGKTSNEIKLTVLDEIRAYVKDGEIVWDSQESALNYLVYYYPLEESNNVKEREILGGKENKTPTWDCKELKSAIDYYHFSIKAEGTKNRFSYTEVTITGKLTNLGKVSKLATPETEVLNGVFNWKAINNAVMYRMFVEENDKELGKVNIENALFYETTFNEPNKVLKYSIKAIGTQDEILVGTNSSATKEQTVTPAETLVYVNSDIDKGKYGKTIEQVKGVEVSAGVSSVDGLLYWDPVMHTSVSSQATADGNDNVNNEVQYYKIIFIPIDEKSIQIGEPIIFNDTRLDEPTKFEKQDGKFYFDCNILNLAGRYMVTIQGYDISNSASSYFDYNNETGYYLAGVKSSPYEFTKYNVISNINIIDGKVVWDYYGEMDKQLEETLRYKLTFTYSGGDIVLYSDTMEFSSYVLKQLQVTTPFNLEIKVIPKIGQKNFIASNGVEYKKDNELVDIYQSYGIISSQDIEIKKIDDGQDLYIVWDNYTKTPTPSGQIEITYKYLVSYWIEQLDEYGNPVKEIKQKIVKDTRINTEEIGFNTTTELTIYYQIQVIPEGDVDYLPSFIDKEKNINKPTALAMVSFNKETATFSWAKSVNTDHRYRIKDEILKVKEGGGYETSYTYYYTTTSNEEFTYTPIEQGLHKVAVAVVIDNSKELNGTLTSAYTYYFDPETQDDKTTGTPVEIKLFESGDGTNINPYIIKNVKQFRNIEHRFEKNEYMNRYRIENELGLQPLTTCEGNNKVFNFKQAVDINLENENDFVSFVKLSNPFNGIYDANKYIISWNIEKAWNNAESSNGTISLFNTFGAKAQFKNAKILLIGSTLKSTGIGAKTKIISGLVNVNMGKINNVLLGNSETIAMESSAKILFGGISSNNIGTLEKCVNTYNLKITSPDVGFGGISYKGGDFSTGFFGDEKPSYITNCANYGRFTINSTTIVAGGIVAITHSQATISGCAFSAGNTQNYGIDLSSSDSQPESIRLGGIVGENQAEVKNSYVKTTIIASSTWESNQGRIIIGGVIGRTSNLKITNVYVDIFKNASSSYDEIHQLIGKIDSESGLIEKPNVYYKEISDSTVGSFLQDDQLQNFTSYTTYETITLDTSIFNKTIDNSSITLVWESNFNDYWKGESK